MLKITIIENGKKVDKIVNIENIGNIENIENKEDKLFKTNVLDKLGLNEVPLNQLTLVQNVNDHIEELCCICQENFLLGSQKRILRCNHFFHDLCIEKWLTSKITCPLCSKDLID